MLFSECAVCNIKNVKFLKEQEAKWLLSNLTGVKNTISKILFILIK